MKYSNYGKRNYQPKLSFRNVEELKNDSSPQKLREFTTRKPQLQEILKGLFSLKQRTKGHKTTTKITNKLTG